WRTREKPSYEESSMPQPSLTREQWADLMQEWWANFPFHTDDRNARHEAVGRFEQQYGPLSEREKSKALRNWSPALKEKVGIRRVYAAPTDIGEKEAEKLCESLLD